MKNPKLVIPILFVSLLSATGVVWALCNGHDSAEDLAMESGSKIEVLASVDGKWLAPDHALSLDPRISGKELLFELTAWDNDKHVCQSGTVGNYLKETDIRVVVTRQDPGKTELGSIKLKPYLSGMNQIWTNKWEIPAAEAGQELLFTYYGEVDDVECEAKLHKDSNDKPPIILGSGKDQLLYQAKVVVYGVRLVKIKAGNAVDLEPGTICLNAQPEYMKALWQAVITPSNTFAKAALAPPGPGFPADVSLAGFSSGGNTSDPKLLRNGDKIWVLGGTKTGAYSLILTHCEGSNVRDTGDGTAFRFVIITSTDRIPIETGSGNSKHRELDTTGSYPEIRAFTKLPSDPTANTPAGHEVDAGMYWASGPGSGAKGQIWVTTDPPNAKGGSLYAGNVRWTVKIAQYRGYLLKATAGPIGNAISLSAKIGPVGLGLKGNGKLAVSAWNYTMGFPHVGMANEAGTVVLNGADFLPFPTPIVTQSATDWSDIVTPNTLFAADHLYPLTGGSLVAVERRSNASSVQAYAHGMARGFDAEAKDSDGKQTTPQIVP